VGDDGAARYDDEELKLIANEITALPNDDTYGQALDEVQKKQQMHIHLRSMPPMPVLNQIKDVLLKHPGSAQVFLKVGLGAGAKKIKTQTQIKISDELVGELKDVEEVSKVDVE
jgi:hypothetical protein